MNVLHLLDIIFITNYKYNTVERYDVYVKFKQNTRKASEVRVSETERQRVPPDKPRILPERPKQLIEPEREPANDSSDSKTKETGRRDSEGSSERERDSTRPAAQRTDSLPPRRPPPPVLPPQRLVRAYSQASPRHHEPPSVTL